MIIFIDYKGVCRTAVATPGLLNMDRVMTKFRLPGRWRVAGLCVTCVVEHCHSEAGGRGAAGQ